jgi:predicted dienelactone hydrolase
MRPFEWLFFLSFLPALFLSYRVATRHQYRTIAALVPMLFGGLHLVFEGWRSQMIPLYAFASLLIVLRFVWPKRAVTRRPGRFISAFTVLAFLAAGLLPGWLLPILTLPASSGPYPVGLVDRELHDTARGRRLMVSVWYPAAQSGAPAPLFQQPQAVVAGMASAFGLPAAAPLLQHMRYFTVAASGSVAVRDQRAPFPVLVFSHGLVGLRAQNSSTLQELASWGYVVVALDHTDAAAVTVFPDGETRPFDLQRFGISPEDTERSTEVLLPIWVADQRFVYDTLSQWARNDPLLAGRLDLQRMGSFGHSFGGATALAVCQVEQRCRAAAILDGGVAESQLTRPAMRPLLLMSSSESHELPDAMAKWGRLIGTAVAPAYWLELPNSNHYSFTIVPMLSPVLAPPGANVRNSLGVVDTYLRAFFDLYLLGKATPLLEPTAGATDVRWHSR